MSGAMRKVGKAGKDLILPLVFVSMLPMCSPAIALPRKETNYDIKKIESDSYNIYVMFRSGFGKMMRELYQHGKFQAIGNLGKSIQSKQNPVLDREILILEKGKNLNNPGRFDLAISSLFQNSYQLAKLYRSDKPSYERYMAQISALGFPLLKDKVEQWIKNGAKDVVILLKEIISCKP